MTIMPKRTVMCATAWHFNNRFGQKKENGAVDGARTRDPRRDRPVL